MIDFTLPPEIEDLRKRVREFIEEEVRPAEEKLAANEGDRSELVRTIIELGRNMNLHVIAEGVETDAQLAFLRQCGCTLIQGFVLSRPKPIDELIALYRPK